jgi:hypothetical protein
MGRPPRVAEGGCVYRVLNRIETVPFLPRTEQIEGAYLGIFNRAPTADEVRQAAEFLARQEECLSVEGRTAEELALPEGVARDTLQEPFAAAALVDLVLALFNANEFAYLD